MHRTRNAAYTHLTLPMSRLERRLVAVVERELAVNHVRPIHLGPAVAPGLRPFLGAVEVEADIGLAVGAVQGREDHPEAELAADAWPGEGDEGGLDEIEIVVIPC